MKDKQIIKVYARVLLRNCFILESLLHNCKWAFESWTEQYYVEMHPHLKTWNFDNPLNVLMLSSWYKDLTKDQEFLQVMKSLSSIDECTPAGLAGEMVLLKPPHSI